VGYDEGSRTFKFLPDGTRRWVVVRSLICDENIIPTTNVDNRSWDLINDITVAEDKQNQTMEPEAGRKVEDKEQLVAAKSVRRVTRKQLQERLEENLALVVVDEYGAEYHVPGHGISMAAPKSIKEAFNGSEAMEWKAAVKEEMEAIEGAETLSEPVQLPEGEKAVSLKFIFVKKIGADGKVGRYKARLVYNHTGNGESSEDNYAPVANKVSLRIFLAAVAGSGWKICQADVKTAFLNADNPGKEYVRLPKGIVQNESDRIRILLKALYGLQRAPKMWYITFANWAQSIGFKQSENDPCLFIHEVKRQMIIIYVDDMLLAAEGQQLLDEMCNVLTGKFQSKVMGIPEYFLGMNLEYDQSKRRIMMSQQTYIKAIVQKYGLETLLPRSLPMAPGMVLRVGEGREFSSDGEKLFQQYGSLVGALLFLAVCTRPDISFAVGILSKFVTDPRKEHWDAAVNLVGYLKGTLGMGIELGQIEDKQVYGYADSDWGSDVDDRMSISGGVVFWGGSIVSWHSRKQHMISLSTAEAESHAMVDMAKEVIYVKRVLSEMQWLFDWEEIGVPTIYCDNQPAMDAVLNGKGRTKHYDLRIKFLGFGVLKGLFEIKKVATRDNVADIFTKALKATRFKWLVSAIASMYKFGEAEFEGRCG
jgi:hypothetical protein